MLEPGGIYIHASSLGEVTAISPFILLLKERHPEIPIFLTTFTETGLQRAQELFGETVKLARFPFDLRDRLEEIFRAGKFRALLVVETELWPNLILTARRHRVPMFLVNARISPRTLKRYRVFKGLFSSLLSSFKLILTQSKDDMERFLYLGAPQDRVKVVGSLKYDVFEEHIEPPSGFAKRAPVTVVFGSIRSREENIVLDAVREVIRKTSDIYIIIAPRHLNRIPHLREYLDSHGIVYSLRTSGNQKGRVLLLDTLGELRSFYSVADIAFVGGTLAPYGGHNLVEPALLGLPVLFGPYYYNTADTARGLIKSGGGIKVNGREDLVRTLLDLVAHPEKRKLMGQNARNFILSQRGVTEALYRELAPFITSE